ncbi:ABC transporter substrate-binding protein [Zwartia sp.]|uniref:ABC transporter substrate-binding protein n=1 Tax=Zwartia sp. TaxID=2978004 RepID=UPI0027182FA4|nr:ABC transporter substrate-binding protein [Zwartia sp.]MDO9025956.1 ABC transporter substrate-binding protein [Zwartia sp.]
MKKIFFAAALSACVLLPLAARADVTELKVPLGAGGFGFLPLHIMKQHNLVEKHAAKLGHTMKVNWSNIGGPSAMIDALLSGSAHFISAGPPSFLILWDRTKGNANVKGVAAMSSMPMNLNTRAEHLKSIDDLRPTDKIAVTSVKSSIPSIIMQMYAVEKYGKDQAFRFDPYTVTMNHGDAAAALLSGSSGITGHYASAPLDQLERKSPGVRSIMNTDTIMGGSTTFTMISARADFQQKNPKVFAAFVSALKEAQEMIAKDKGAAADTLIESMGGSSKWSKADMVELLNDPSIKYTTKPENVMKYATFMHQIGSMKNAPKSIDELFFAGADVSGGN